MSNSDTPFTALLGLRSSVVLHRSSICTWAVAYIMYSIAVNLYVYSEGIKSCCMGELVL